MDVHVRQPIAAGTFYPADPADLLQTVRTLLGNAHASRGILRHPLGLIVPHAGYMYSGAVAAKGYAATSTFGRPELVVVLGANHTGLGSTVTLPDVSPWRTPLGSVPVDEDRIRDLSLKGLAINSGAFQREHSIEVQLPFMQFLWPEGFRLVPICVQYGRLEELKAAAKILATSLVGESVLVVVSTDFTHYETEEVARTLDHGALELILRMDASAFHRHIQEHQLSICGAGAVTLLLLLSKMLGWSHAARAAYATSGDTTGDRSAVVGYAAALLRGGDDD